MRHDYVVAPELQGRRPPVLRVSPTSQIRPPRLRIDRIVRRGPSFSCTRTSLRTALPVRAVAVGPGGCTAVTTGTITERRLAAVQRARPGRVRRVSALGVHRGHGYQSMASSA